MEIPLKVENFLSFEKFLSIEHFSSAENFLSMENFFIDPEFIKTIQNFIIDREYIFFIGVSAGQQSLLAPLHNRQNIKANNFILGRLGKKQPCKVRMSTNTAVGK